MIILWAIIQKKQNNKLRQEITERQRAEEALGKYQKNLENMVTTRTAELSTANEQLKQEIQERKQAEEALRESEQHFRIALGAARVAVWDWNLRENYTTWSDTAEEVLGFQPGSFGNNYEAYMKWVHPDDIEAINDRVSRVSEEKLTDYKSEYRVIRPDGEVRWTSAPGQVFHDSEGEPFRIAGIMMDITDRKQAEEALRESEKKFRNLFDDAPIMYVITEERNGVPIIKDINKKFRNYSANY